MRYCNNDYPIKIATLGGYTDSTQFSNTPKAHIVGTYLPCCMQHMQQPRLFIIYSWLNNVKSQFFSFKHPVLKFPSAKTKFFFPLHNFSTQLRHPSRVAIGGHVWRIPITHGLFINRHSLHSLSFTAFMLFHAISCLSILSWILHFPSFFGQKN